MKHDYAKIKLECLLRDLSNYTTDEFRRQMMRIASGATGQDIPDDAHTIKAERDAFLAELQKANAIIIDLQRNPPKFTELHLAEIRAEAVADFAKALSNTVQIPNGAMTRVDYYKAAIRHAIQFASRYAEQIRQGGAK